MITIVDIFKELKESGISVTLDFDSNIIRMYRNLVHEKSLTEKYPTVEDKYYTKGTYNLYSDVEQSLFKAMKYFMHDSGRHEESYKNHLARYSEENK